MPIAGEIRSEPETRGGQAPALRARTKKSAKDRPPPYAENNVSRSLKVCKTLMSIAAQTQKALRAFRSLIGFARAARVFIKDLKDLDDGTTRVSIDIKVLKDLKT